MDEIEELDQGLLVQRGEGGKFIHTELTPERAREMQKARADRRGRNQESEVDELLRGRGVEPDDAPIELVALARQVVKGGSGISQNIRTLLALTGGQADINPSVSKPNVGQRCPCCGEIYNPGAGKIPPELAYKLAEIALRIQKERAAEQGQGDREAPNR